MADASLDFDYVVVGSGFGGSVSAHRLTEKGYRVAVIEMGRRWTPETLPTSTWDFSRWLWRPRLGLRGHFNISLFRHVVVMHGCAVGGGSITYGNVMLVPPDSIWQSGSWAGTADWIAEMPAHFATAARMLGVVRNSIMGPADRILEQGAETAGVAQTLYRSQVAVFQAAEGEAGGKTYPDPYFGGEGPDRTTCIGCGGCLVGCRFNAKNTLDKNYLYLAEKHGARVFPETRVVDVICRNGQADGSEGYEVLATRSVAGSPTETLRFTCRGLVFAASALGTMDLLFQLKQTRRLPAISDQLGNRVRTNAESLIGVRIPGSSEDLSQGVAIGSGVYLREHTHVEAVRYPRGSDAMGLLTTLLTPGTPGRGRRLRWLWTCARALLRHPLRMLSTLNPSDWAKETLVLLCMQSVDCHVDMRLGRPWYWPFDRVLVSRGKSLPSFIPEANKFASLLATLTGGSAISLLSEILFDIPGTAHILGGCTIGASAQDGVVDFRHRVFGYRNMYICDGSVVAANPGVNPALTICALTERAMSFIPAAGSDG